MPTSHLTKSRFLAGQQCELRLWYTVHEPGLAPPLCDSRESVFKTGRQVGALARARFAGHVLVAEGAGPHAEAAARTARLLARRAVPAICEGAFEHAGVRIRADVLIRGRSGAFDLVEVKSSTRVREIHDLDLAVQAWVIAGSGLKLAQLGVLTLDRGYVWPGGALDLQALFKLHDRTARAMALQSTIGQQVSRLHAVLAAGYAPRIEPGPQCTSPYVCPFLAHCTRDVVVPEWPLSSLPALRASTRDALLADEVDDVRDIPDAFALNRLQDIARRAVISGQDVVHGDLGGAFADLEYPIHYLDFETAGPAIPAYANTRPYDAVPFQFSVHRELPDASVRHIEYLHTEETDPREPLALALLEALTDAGSIVVYSPYEQRVIGILAEHLPALAPRLMALIPRLHDLLPVIRGGYYHPDFRGSFSIKSVLPALAPELAYDDLQIADGNAAAHAYLQALEMPEPADRAPIFESLRAYCARDTFGLLRIRRVLARRALLEAYRTTHYEVDCGDGLAVIHIGAALPARLVEAMTGQGVERAAFLTAYNPRSAQVSSDDNARAQSALLTELEAAGIALLPGRGRGADGRWPAEPSVLALGLTHAPALELAERHGQNAFVEVILGEPARLVLTAHWDAGDGADLPSTA